MFNFIVNPNTLDGKNKYLTVQIGDRLYEEGIEHHFYYSKAKGDCYQFAKSLTEGGETDIVVVGGDGTLDEVVRGLADPAKVNLGLIPTGTGNDFAATAGIPEGIDAIEAIVKRNLLPTDYLEFSDGRRCINIVGVGIDVDVLQRYQEKKKKSKAAYFKCLMAAIKKYEGLDLEVVADGTKKSYHAILAAACNGKQFGGGRLICPAAEIDDGKIDLVIVDYPQTKLMLELIALKKGMILDRAVTHHIRCESFSFRPAAETETFQSDGELFDAKEISAKIVSGKLHMFRG